MSNTTLTPGASVVRTDDDAPAVVAPLPTPAMLADALAAVSIAGDAGDTAGATLASIARARYAFHAARYATTVHTVMTDDDGAPVVNDDGAPVVVASIVLPDNYKRDAAGAVWRDATGSASAPDTKGRTKGERSLATYLSQFASIATDTRHGLASLADDDAFKTARDAIKSRRERERANGERAVARNAHAAFVAWRDALPTNDRAALARVVRLLTDDASTGREHAAAFIAILSA